MGPFYFYRHSCSPGSLFDNNGKRDALYPILDVFHGDIYTVCAHTHTQAHTQTHTQSPIHVHLSIRTEYRLINGKSKIDTNIFFYILLEDLQFWQCEGYDCILLYMYSISTPCFPSLLWRIWELLWNKTRISCRNVLCRSNIGNPCYLILYKGAMLLKQRAKRRWILKRQPIKWIHKISFY